MYFELEPKDYLTVTLGTLTVIGLLGVAAGFMWYYVRRGAREAGDQALSNWKNLAESRKAQLDTLEEEKAELATRLVEKGRELVRCERTRDDFAQLNLRLNARLEKYERCINRLEVRAGLAVTNFDDPTIHNTASPLP